MMNFGRMTPTHAYGKRERADPTVIPDDVDAPANHLRIANSGCRVFSILA